MTSHSRPVATTPSPFSFSSKNSSTEQVQPHLSGAYIRSLVKQLSSSSSTARSRAQYLNTMTSATPLDHQQQPQREQEQAPPKPRVKKQVRRRIHTTRPYQERLLNMAEARREIVAALRIHRANMRQQSEDREEQPQPQPYLQLHQQQQQQVQVMLQEQNQAVELEGVPVAMGYVSFCNHLCSSPLAHLIASAPDGSYSPSMLPYDDLTQPEVPAAIGGLECHVLENLACNFPAQPLGLNLSLQGFGGSLDDAKNSDDLFGVPLIQSSSPASSYSAYPSSVTAMASAHGSPAFCTAENASSVGATAPLSPVLDDGEKHYLIGERHGMEMEWRETAANVAAAASAWWSKILENMESGGGESTGARMDQVGAVGMADDDGVVAGFPEWLCDGVGEQGVTGAKLDAWEMHVDDGDYNCCYRGDHSDDRDDIALPWYDMNLQWL
ncbi:uncharacterized protein LOC133890379 [Phragmites australis]|uniref:uncharacterized protein LOC133890379 n=1 Tax=Phragmites australis TaxID=29695 RepID=UPI002D76A42E|nr:uncharacterized protein LOC133890379 [Phragmites australis]